MSAWTLIVLVALIGVAALVVARWSAPMTGELQLYRKEDRDGHDMDVCVQMITLHGRVRMASLDRVDATIPDSAARIFVMAHRDLFSGVVRLRVGIRFTALRRGAIRDMPEGGRLLILGLEARHVLPERSPTPTAVFTEPN